MVEILRHSSVCLGHHPDFGLSLILIALFLLLFLLVGIALWLAWLIRSPFAPEKEKRLQSKLTIILAVSTICLMTLAAIYTYLHDRYSRPSNFFIWFLILTVAVFFILYGLTSVCIFIIRKLFPKKVVSMEQSGLEGGVKEKHKLWDSKEWEFIFGGNLLNKIGALAIVIGLVYFLKLSFERGWISPTVRVIMGLLAGTGFIVFGEYLFRKKYKAYSFVVIALGVALLYLTTWAGFQILKTSGGEPVLGQAVAFTLLIIFTATSSILSIRYNALPLAIISIIGGFLTPALVSTGKDNQIVLFTYISILNLGIFFISLKQKWSGLELLGFFFTAITFSVWYDKFGQYYSFPLHWRTIFFLGVLFLIYTAIGVLSPFITKRLVKPHDIIMIISIAVAYFGTSYGILRTDTTIREYIGFFPAILAVFYFTIANLIYTTGRKEYKFDYGLYYTLYSLALLFATITIPVQFEKKWVVVTWSIEGAILVWLSSKVKSNYARLLGIALVIISTFLLFITRWPVLRYVFLNERFGAALCLILSCYAIFYIYKKYIVGQEVFASWGKVEFPVVLPLILLVASVVTLWAVSVDINDRYDNIIGGKEREMSEIWEKQQASKLKVEKKMFEEQRESILQEIINNRMAKEMFLSAFWALYAFIILFVGLLKEIFSLRIYSYILFIIVCIKVFLFDIRGLSELYRVAVFIVLGVLLLVGSFLHHVYRRKGSKVQPT